MRVLQSLDVVSGSAGHRLRRVARHATVLALFGCVVVSAVATAARDLPRNALYGKLTAFAYPFANIGGKALRMSPGAKIYNEQNLIIMPAAMRQQAKVLYRLDNAGALSAMWLLTEHEAAPFEARLPKPVKPKPDTGAASGTAPAPKAQ